MVVVRLLECPRLPLLRAQLNTLQLTSELTFQPSSLGTTMVIRYGHVGRWRCARGVPGRALCIQVREVNGGFHLTLTLHPAKCRPQAVPGQQMPMAVLVQQQQLVGGCLDSVLGYHWKRGKEGVD